MLNLSLPESRRNYTLRLLYQNLFHRSLLSSDAFSIYACGIIKENIIFARVFIIGNQQISDRNAR